ncbi:MAG: LCP family protein [Butyrivibrio sp.]|nr:LCP family protein [Butyrivibrio sp.]
MREKQMRRRRLRNFLLAGIIVIMLLAAFILAGFHIFAAIGYRSLKNGAVSAGPTLGLEENGSVQTKAPGGSAGSASINSSRQDTSSHEEEKPSEGTGAPAETEEPEEAEILSVPWQSDWVRYNNKIYDYNDDILTFLFLGIDKMEPVSKNPDLVSGGQSDAIFLVLLNPDTNKISIIGVNRDTMVEIRMVGLGANGEDRYTTAELAVQHGFGDGLNQSCELTRDAVSKLFYNLPIHGYVSFNMGGIGALNDALGGVQLTVSEDMTKIHPGWTQGTEVTLMGQDAYDYVHYRDITIFESARNRLARQKQYLSAMAAAALEGTKRDLTLPLTLYRAFSPYVVTDLSADEITYLASVIAGYSFDGSAIYTLEGSTVKGAMFEEFYPDQAALKDLIIRLYYREIDAATGKPKR